MLLEFLTSRRLTLHGLLVMAGLAVYVIASHARRQRRHPSAAIAWVVSLALMPYLALPLYILFGSRKVVRGAPAARSTPALRLNANPSSALAPRFQHLAAAMGLPHAVSCRQLAVHQDGREALDALRSVIQGAGATLDVCTFLLGRDALGREVIDLLARQSRAGVQVRLLIDGIGVYLGGRPDLKPLSAAGVRVVRFVSPFRSPLPGRTNLRNHRKMVIADGQRLWSGGRNLAAEYFVGDLDCKPPKTPWTDLSFDLQGDLARQAQQRFEMDWAFATQAHPPALPLAEFAPPAEADGAQLVASGPDQAEDTLYSLLISSCFTARRRILVVTPYFVPDATLLMALTLAARRGVAVDLVLPRRSNHRLADMARPAALREMSAAGARVWLAEAMVHAKAVVIDGELALAGSANLDERSLFLNYELMVAFFKPADVQRFARWIAQQRAAAATPYQAHAPRALQEFGEGLIRWLAFQL